MLDVLESLRAVVGSGRRAALVTVAQTWNSAPRPVGSVMLIDDEGAVSGAVSGGCVEAAIVEAAAEVLKTGEPADITYGVSDDDAFAVGLTCGGTIRVLIEAVGETSWPEVNEAFAAIDDGRSVAFVTYAGEEQIQHLVVTNDGAFGSLGNERLTQTAAADARAVLDTGRGVTRHYGFEGQRMLSDTTVVIRSVAKPQEFVIFGAIDYAQALASLAKTAGYYVVVCDARPLFVTEQRFPDVDELVREWPHSWLANHSISDQTVICVLTHDPKFDVPVLEVALRSPAAYVGAMGSRRTHEDRLQRLRSVGLSDAELAKLRSPIGLDLNASSPEDTAISILAEVVRTKNGGTGQPLTDLSGPIHVDDGNA